MMVTLTEDRPWHALDGEAPEGVAGGGAWSWTARIAQSPPNPVPVASSAYSWKVHTVWSSFGSTSVKEKSPQRFLGQVPPGPSQS